MTTEHIYRVDEEQPQWGETYLLAEVWYCGDDHCNCSQAQVNRIIPNLTEGPPWISREEVWRGPFYSWGEGRPEADLEAYLSGDSIP